MAGISLCAVTEKRTSSCTISTRLAFFGDAWLISEAISEPRSGWLPRVFANTLTKGRDLKKETLLISLNVFPAVIYQHGYRYNKASYFGCEIILDHRRYHGNITSNERQIYSYFWPKFLIFVLSFGEFFLPRY